MGRYDTLPDFSTLCPNCGEVLNGFQSKDGPGEFREIRFGVPFDRGNDPKREPLDDLIFCAYDICGDCEIWVDAYFETIPVTNGIVIIYNRPIKIVYTEAL